MSRFYLFPYNFLLFKDPIEEYRKKRYPYLFEKTSKKQTYEEMFRSYVLGNVSYYLNYEYDAEYIFYDMLKAYVDELRYLSENNKGTVFGIIPVMIKEDDLFKSKLDFIYFFDGKMKHMYFDNIYDCFLLKNNRKTKESRKEKE